MAYTVILIGWPLLALLARLLTIIVYIKHGFQAARLTYGLWGALAVIYGLIVPVYYLL